MIINISKRWCEYAGREELGLEVGAGLIGLDPISDQADEHAHDEARVALCRFVNLKRRKIELTLEALAERADIDIAELMNIEQDPSYLPEPRTLFQLAMVFDVDQKKLMGLSGLTQARNFSYIEEAVRYAARSQVVEELSPEEQAALDGLISVLSKQ